MATGVTRNLVAYLPEERTGDMLTKDGVPDLARVCPTNAAKRCHVKKVSPHWNLVTWCPRCDALVSLATGDGLVATP